MKSVHAPTVARGVSRFLFGWWNRLSIVRTDPFMTPLRVLLRGALVAKDECASAGLQNFTRALVVGGIKTKRLRRAAGGDKRLDEPVGRSEERRVGKECCVECRSRWSPDH